MNVVEIGKKVFSTVNACGSQMPTKCSPENVVVIYLVSLNRPTQSWFNFTETLFCKTQS